MEKQIRLDKYLADMGIGTRSEVKAYLKKGRVQLDGITALKGETKIQPGVNQVVFDGREISYLLLEYIMLNKPAGVITATEDQKDKTVMDLITEGKRKDLFPVGRLDKDTEGLLLITNDGELAHELLSPKKHVGKTYYAKVSGRVTNQDVEAFSQGVVIEEGVITRPAQLNIIESAEISQIELTIYEGKFHQVKRMFEAVDKSVLYLKRLTMGALPLDPGLALGEYRHLTQDEIDKLKENRS